MSPSRPAAPPRPWPDWDNLSFGFQATDWMYRSDGRLGREPIWFCTGTAWTVQPVRELDYRGRTLKLEARALQQALLDEVRGIQLGERADRFGWVTEVTDGS